MFRIICIAALLLLCASGAHAQYFEGKIVYSNTFNSKIKALNNTQLQYIVGSKMDYYIKGCNYKSISNGHSVTMQLYDCSSNRVYNQTPKSDTLYWFSAAINTDTTFKYEIKKNADTVLGYVCDALVLTTKTGTTVLYYSKQLKVNAAAFKDHQYNNWALFTLQTGSLPLKMVIETEVFTMESVATEVQELKLQEGFFLIADKAPVRQSG